MGHNDGVFLKPGPSKADQNGAFWCDKPIWLPFRRDDLVNAARELAEQELMFPVHGASRSDVFADENGQPFSKRQVTTSFNAMLRLVLLASDVKKFSFHRYWIYLACALDAAQLRCPPDKIKRIWRWISDESLCT